MTDLLEDAGLRPEEIEEIRRAFFDQARGALESLTDGILALEGEVPSEERLRPLRRAAHTLKSDCAAVGFPELSTLSHALEDAFAGIDARQRPVSSGQSDVLLAALDVFASGLAAGAAGKAMPSMSRTLDGLGMLARELEDGQGWDEHLTEAARQQIRQAVSAGRHALILRSRGGDARAGQRLRAAARRLGVEVLAAPAARGRGCRSLLGLSATSAADVERAAREHRLAVSVHPFALPGLIDEGPRVDAGREGETVRVEARRLDEVLNLVGELVTVRSTLAGVAAEAEHLLPEDLAARLGETQTRLGRALQELQRSAMGMRMVPVERVFRRFSRVVRDLSRQTGKRLALRVEGQTTELDRGILEALEEPLLHLVRNAADHGIEPPEQRRAAGKPEQGSIRLRASREGNQIMIEVADDGRGIDAAAVRRAAAERGLLSTPDGGVATPPPNGGAGAQPSDARPGAQPLDGEVIQLVFRAGLTTAREVTETSGRGVGLDAVRETVEALKGSIRAANLPQGGASFVIRVPLTVAIIQALLFRIGGQDLAVPLTAVLEIARVADLQLERCGEEEIFRLREDALGLTRLDSLMGLPSAASDPGFVIVLQGSAGRYGVRVDELVGEQELVIKAVHDRWIRTPLVAGAAVVGRGTLALIVDVPAVYRAAFGGGGHA